LLVADASAWHSWLGAHHHEQGGVWLALAKKGVTDPTSLTYDQALEEALCHGWIDGQAMRGDERTYRQRFTPRRARSPWSKRNVAIVERLLAQDRMHPAGLAAVASAKADGRWEAAYAGPATIEVPADLTAALRAEPRAKAMFEILTSQNRYAVLYRIAGAKREETRARHIKRFVAMLARGELPIRRDARSATDRAARSATAERSLLARTLCRQPATVTSTSADLGRALTGAASGSDSCSATCGGCAGSRAAAIAAPAAATPAATRQATLRPWMNAPEPALWTWSARLSRPASPSRLATVSAAPTDWWAVRASAPGRCAGSAAVSRLA
jgi:uncharacterized protein YdeI (YjbR/CyaY-like superfamily)